MESNGRMPPPHLRHPLPNPGMVYPDVFGHGVRPPPGAFPPFDMFPASEVMEQKLNAQHTEMQKLAAVNQSLAATHGALRQELAAAQHELQILHAQIGAAKSEREQHMRSLLDKILKMEAELQAAESVKSELQQARADAHSLVVARQELICKAQKLNQDLHRAHSDVQQIPALMSESESLRQEYQHCRVTFDSERKLCSDHLETLKVMEKNYVIMAGEVEKLRAELTNTAKIDRRTGGPYGSTGYNESEVSGHYPVGQNTYEDGYGVLQGRAPVPGSGTAVATAGEVPHSSLTPPRGGYDPPKVSYDAQRGSTYDGPGYDTQRGLAYEARNYDAQRGYSYDTQRAAGYDALRGITGFDLQKGSGYDTSRIGGYDNAGRDCVNPQGQLAPPNNAPFVYEAHRDAVNPQGPNNTLYGSSTPPNRAVSGGYEAGENLVRR